TLSGGEAQRLKLSKELSKKATGRTVYILDEPTSGLHFDDIKQLLEVLNQLVEQGNTVIVIEHNLDVVKASDCVIDMRPEGRVDGIDVAAEPARAKARIGFSTGSAGLYGRLTAREQLMYFGALHGMDETRLAARIEEVSASVDLTRLLGRRCEKLSTGEKQRV